MLDCSDAPTCADYPACMITRRESWAQVFGCLVVLAIGAAQLGAQCFPVLRPAAGIPGLGVAGQLNACSGSALTWDPDGSGPGAPVLVVGGRFGFAGTGLVNNIATFDPATARWSALSTGTNLQVDALAVLASGELVAGGLFTAAGGVGVGHIARWDGRAFAPLGTGLDGQVTSLLALPNGDLVAAGAFTAAGSVSVNHVARWDGSSWSPLGSGLDDLVYSLARLSNGDLVAGGRFRMAGTTAVGHVARWDGSSWSPLGAGTDGTVLAVTALANGQLIAGGRFQVAGGVAASNVARWDGVSWSALGAGISGGSNIVRALRALPNGEVVVGGSFAQAGGQPAGGVARWDGSGWSTYGVGLTGAVIGLGALPDGELVAAGALLGSSTPLFLIARWDGTAWRTLGSGIDATVRALTVLPGGDLVVGGDFTQAGLAAAGHIARWDGGHLSLLGAGLDGAVHALVTMSNGDVIAGGSFAHAGGQPATGVARWDGASWHPLGAGLAGGAVRALAVHPDGRLVAGGDFVSAGGVAANHLAAWDGAQWQALAGGMNGTVRALAALPGGDVIAAGSSIARWNGISWTQLGSVNNTVYGLAMLPSGDVVAVGDFAVIGALHADNVARWDGAQWRDYGYGTMATNEGLRCAMAMPDGSLLVGGTLGRGSLMRHDGIQWTTVTQLDGAVLALTLRPQGEVLFGGDFMQVYGQLCGHLARYSTTCPASAIEVGPGCAGSAGANALTATSLAWIGAPFRAVASGLLPRTLAVGLFGMSMYDLPLQGLLPQAMPGCMLTVDTAPGSGFAARWMPTATGDVTMTVGIPSTQALVGAQFLHQVLSFGFDAAAQLQEVTVTNTLQVTIGAW